MSTLALMPETPIHRYRNLDRRRPTVGEGACITGLSWILPPALLVLFILLPSFLRTALPRGDVELVVLADVEGEQEHVGGKVVVQGDER